MCYKLSKQSYTYNQGKNNRYEFQTSFGKGFRSEVMLSLLVGDNPASLRSWDNSSNKFQCALLLKLGTH